MLVERTGTRGKDQASYLGCYGGVSVRCATGQARNADQVDRTCGIHGAIVALSSPTRNEVIGLDQAVAVWNDVAVSGGGTTNRLVAGGLTFFYKSAGQPDDPPMVLLHGMGESAASWDPVLAD